MKVPRVLIAGLFHETHTFLDEATGLDQFQCIRGEQLLACEGDGSPLGGALEAAAKFGWQVISTIDCRAQPSGTAADEVFERFWSELRPQVEKAVASGLDALYLVLHGAMVTQSHRDVEGELLERLRGLAAVESLPIFGVFDLHANFSQRMAQHADCLVAYRHNPHSDACATAVRAAELLNEHLARGAAFPGRPDPDGLGSPSYDKRPRTYYCHAGIIWPPTGTGTAESPMFELEALARKLEVEHNVLAVNVVGGFSFADTPDTGVSFSVVTRGEASQAQAMLEQLCQLAWELREAGNKVDPPLDEVMHELWSSEPNRSLIVVVEPSDNIGGGAPGDGTGLLRALVAYEIENAAVCVCDPEAVVAVQHLQLGERVTLSLGGKGSRLDEGPLPLEVELVSRSDGRFALEDRQSHLATMYGVHFNMGPCAVVRHGGITILLTSIKTPPFDLGQWRSQGIEPTKLAVIGVKAAVAHRRAYDPIAARMVWVDTPGPCRSDLRKLPYQHVRRPVFPLDE